MYVCMVDSRINICTMYMLHDTTFIVFCFKRKHPGYLVNTGSEEGGGAQLKPSTKGGFLSSPYTCLRNHIIVQYLSQYHA